MPAPALANAFSGLTNREDVATLLSTSAAQLELLLRTRSTSQRYKEFFLSKRRGGTRRILAPRDDLKSLQQKLAVHLDATYLPRAVAYAFIRGRSVADNADRHLRHRYVLNVDIKDFFHSINFGRVRGLFISLGAMPAAATVLSHICCHDGALPQGAPTSPVISNMICVKMDRELLALARAYHCCYSRYADDMTFSRRRGAFPPSLAHHDEAGTRTVLGTDLRAIIEKNGFAPHPEKIWLFNGQGRQIVTGLVVNVKRNVRREWVRQLRAMIHAWEAHGLANAEAEYHYKYSKTNKRGDAHAPFSQMVAGKMQFLKMIKGAQDAVYRGLQRRLVRANPAYFSVMQKENEAMTKRDVFISHASEDKAAVAKELADLLIAKGISVWYDEYSIDIGDDILHKIDDGLVNSQYGVVIFSPNFFAAKKTWTAREYSGLVAGEDVDKTKRIIPIWHEIDRASLYKKSPTIANRMALLTCKLSIEEIASKMAAHVRKGTPI